MTSPSIWDRITQGAGRLFGVPQGLLGDEAQRYATNQGLLGFGTSLLGASGYAPPGQQPLSTNQILAQGIQAGQAGARGGIEMGLAMEEREKQMAREEALRQIALQYADKWNDPQAIREMAGQLMQLGFTDEAKAALDLVKSIPQRQIVDLAGPEGQNTAYAVNPEDVQDRVPIGARYQAPEKLMFGPNQNVRGRPWATVMLPTTGETVPIYPAYEKPDQAREPTAEEKVRYATTAAAEFRGRVKEDFDRAFDLRSNLDVALQEAVNAADGAAQIQLLTKFLLATDRRGGSLRAANSVVQSTETLNDMIAQARARATRAKSSPVPDHLLPLMARVVEAVANDLDARNNQSYEDMVGVFESVGYDPRLLMRPHGYGTAPLREMVPSAPNAYKDMVK